MRRLSDVLAEFDGPEPDDEPAESSNPAEVPRDPYPPHPEPDSTTWRRIPGDGRPHYITQGGRVVCWARLPRSTEWAWVDLPAIDVLAVPARGSDLYPSRSRILPLDVALEATFPDWPEDEDEWRECPICPGLELRVSGEARTLRSPYGVRTTPRPVNHYMAVRLRKRGDNGSDGPRKLSTLIERAWGITAAQPPACAPTAAPGSRSGATRRIPTDRAGRSAR